MAAPNIGYCVNKGVEILKKNPIPFVVGFLLLSFISSVTLTLLLGPLAVGYMRMVKIDDEGGKAEIGDLFKGFDDFVPALVAFILSFIIMFVGMLLCYIPGLLVSPIVMISLYLVAVGEKDGVNAVKRAWKAFMTKPLEAFVCYLVLMIIGMVGYIACCVGAFFTLPVTLIGSYYMAKQLTEGGGGGGGGGGGLNQ